jgi:hypothetical protein
VYEEGGVECHTAATPQVGEVNMAMIAISHVALSLYHWIVVVLRLLADKNFLLEVLEN